MLRRDYVPMCRRHLSWVVLLRGRVGLSRRRRRGGLLRLSRVRRERGFGVLLLDLRTLNLFLGVRRRTSSVQDDLGLPLLDSLSRYSQNLGP